MFVSYFTLFAFRPPLGSGNYLQIVANENWLLALAAFAAILALMIGFLRFMRKNPTVS
ncbi:MAG: hypothetical protein ABSB19_04705 [Methylomonas sp.]|jgi:hypothetical protein